jgi:hypothetical protein
MFVELNPEQLVNLVKLVQRSAGKCEIPLSKEFWKEIAERLNEPFEPSARRLVIAPPWAQFFGGRVSAEGQTKLVQYEDIKEFKS